MFYNMIYKNAVSGTCDVFTSNHYSNFKQHKSFFSLLSRPHHLHFHFFLQCLDKISSPRGTLDKRDLHIPQMFFYLGAKHSYKIMP